MDLMGYERLFLHIHESYDVDIYVKDMVYFQNESRIPLFCVLTRMPRWFAFKNIVVFLNLSGISWGFAADFFLKQKSIYVIS